MKSADVFAGENWMTPAAAIWSMTVFDMPDDAAPMMRRDILREEVGHRDGRDVGGGVARVTELDLDREAGVSLR